MRQKRIKYVNLELLASHGVILDQVMVPNNGEKTYLEIGSGKGKFITSMAKDHPDDLFIAMELNKYVCYRIVEKKIELGLTNLIIILGNAKDLLAYVGENQIDGLYLNFSDPWPKVKQQKRRLTAPLFLEMYQKVLKDGAFLQFRTDHQDLFDYSIEKVHGYFEITDLNFHLEETTYMTEYEEKKRQEGPIYQLIGKVSKHVEKSI
jgi:tRNA (guanine-N7-)-methyltransferase